LKSDLKNKISNLASNVQNQSLPNPRDWSFRRIWQNPWVIAEYYSKTMEDEHTQLLKKHLKLYTDAGGKYNRPCLLPGHRSYMMEGSMIEWIKKNGTGNLILKSLINMFNWQLMRVLIKQLQSTLNSVGRPFRYR
jgi:hypothetical protein